MVIARELTCSAHCGTCHQLACAPATPSREGRQSQSHPVRGGGKLTNQTQSTNLLKKAMAL